LFYLLAGHIFCSMHIMSNASPPTHFKDQFWNVVFIPDSSYV